MKHKKIILDNSFKQISKIVNIIYIKFQI